MSNPLAGIWQRASTNRTTAVLSVVTLLVLLTAVPLTVYLSKQQQTIEQHAAGTSPEVSIAPVACSSSPTDTVIILDKSGSMLGSKITAAKTAASSFVDILSQNPRNKVALVTFSTVGTTDVPFTSNFASVKTKISSITPNGSTCLECAIKQAAAQMQAQSQDGNKKVVVVLTDGIANSIAQNFAGTLSMVTQPDSETKVLAASTNRNQTLLNILNGGSPTKSVTASPTPIHATSAPTQSGSGLNSNIPTRDIGSNSPTGTGGIVTNSGGNAMQSIAEQNALTAAKSAYTTYQSPFYTIGLGGDVNTDFLKQLATATGGTYNFSPTGDQLTAIYNSISQVIGKGSVTGFVYNDTNGNGVFDTGEQKLPDFTLILKNPTTGETIAETTTSATGEFTISGICDGTYQFSAQAPTPTGAPAWQQTGPTNPSYYTITVSGGSSSGDKDFGFKQGAPSSSPTIACTPRPACLDNFGDAGPCVMPTPAGGWCSVTPSPTPTLNPTPTCVPAYAPLPTGGAYCPEPSPTATPSANDTQITLTLLLHGIGSAGDNVSSQSSLSNQNPLHPERGVNVQVFNTANQLVADQVGNVTYSSASGTFIGTVDLGSAITTGSYNVKVKTDQYLASLLPGIQTITAGTVNNLPPTPLIAGDVDNNNVLNILDYNILMGCYSDFAPAVSCTDAQKQMADINDDGVVNQYDYNLFLRELTVHYGQ